MNAELTTLLAEVKAIDREVEGLLLGLGEAELNAAPVQGEWSAGQQIDHLLKVGRLFQPKLEAAIVGLRSENKVASGPFRYSLMERTVIGTMNPTTPMQKAMLRTMPVPPAYEPTTEPLFAIPLLADFAAMQTALRHSLTEADGLDWCAVKVASPVAQNIRLTLGAWFHGLVAHEHYHVNKAKGVKAAVVRPR